MLGKSKNIYQKSKVKFPDVIFYKDFSQQIFTSSLFFLSDLNVQPIIIIFKHCKIQATGRLSRWGILRSHVVYTLQRKVLPHSRYSERRQQDRPKRRQIYITLHGVRFKTIHAVFSDKLISPWLQHCTRRMWQFTCCHDSKVPEVSWNTVNSGEWEGRSHVKVGVWTQQVVSKQLFNDCISHKETLMEHQTNCRAHEWDSSVATGISYDFNGEIRRPSKWKNVSLRHHVTDRHWDSSPGDKPAGTRSWPPISS
jgi:hypothetical protein